VDRGGDPGITSSGLLMEKSKMTLNEFLEKTQNLTRGNSDLLKFLVRPAVICRDGFSISIQGGTWHHYCQPRPKQGFIDPEYIEAFELGYPNRKEPLIMGYIDGSEGCPLSSVYGYVPRNVVEAVLEKHGGIDEGKTLKNIKNKVGEE
jgi:hypothetical protein